jgi:LysR family transcriptional regulator, glycine cleavage system transcriptional activator
MLHLPSIYSLSAFEAAARYLSFVQAADERNVTPGAISRQIQSLEDILGVRLFTRHHKRVELTQAGRDYHAAIRNPLEQIAAATTRTKRLQENESISICVYPTFAIRWLIPRWGRFYDLHPDLDLRLVTSLNQANFIDESHDLTIQVLGTDECPAGMTAMKLFEVDTYPVCSPRVAAEIETIEDLSKQTFLQNAPRHTDWNRWLAAAGVPNLQPARELHFESLNLAIQAAIEGIGVVIGVEAMLHDDLEQGRLVRLFNTTRRSARPFQIVYANVRENDPRLVLFRDWLLSEAAG